jgi:hypothetical protein
MNNKAKVVIAVICLAIAGFAVANQLGLFGSGAPKRPTATQNAAQTGGTGDATTTTTDENATPDAGTLKKDNF